MSLTYENEDQPFEDETFVERLIGLTEMFPEPFRHATSKSVKRSWHCLKNTFKICRNAGWIIASVLVIGTVPVLFEIQRDTILNEEADQQRKLMFGSPTDGPFNMPPTIRAV